MPTGYTDRVKSGKIAKFSDFALVCARAFGALVDMRDEPSNTPLPKRIEPSTKFYDDMVATSSARIEEALHWTTAEAWEKAQEQYRQEVASNEEALREIALARRRYEGMLESVRAWEPPSPDHQELKAFMIQQLESSIEFDCSTSYYDNNPPQQLSAEEFRTERLKSATRDLDYAKEKRDELIDRSYGRNEWLQQLFKSLGLEYEDDS